MAVNTQNEHQKTCLKCQTEKPLSEYHTYTAKSGSILYKSYCKVCSRLRSKKWYNDNHVDALEYRRQYRKDNPEKYAYTSYHKRMKETGVYLFKNIITGETYIGAAKNMSRRVSRHFSPRGRTRNKYIYKSIKTYGKQAHVWGILEYTDTIEQAFERETHYIHIYNPPWNTMKK